MPAEPGTPPIPAAAHPMAGGTPPADPTPAAPPAPPAPAQTPPPPPAPAAQPGPAPTPAATPPAADADLEAWKAWSRQWEDRAKANADAAAKLAEIEAAKLSTEERLAAQNGDLQSKLSAAQTELWRYQAAAANGLTETQAKRLTGATLEEFQADAVALRADLGLPAAAGNGRPVETRSPVPVPSTAGAQQPIGQDMDDWMRNQRR